MYIPEFWCGVIVTILSELVATIVSCIYFSKKGGDER